MEEPTDLNPKDHTFLLHYFCRIMDNAVDLHFLERSASLPERSQGNNWTGRFSCFCGDDHKYHIEDRIKDTKRRVAQMVDTVGVRGMEDLEVLLHTLLQSREKAEAVVSGDSNG